MPAFLSSINLGKNELQNALIHKLASAPSSPVEGQLYYDTVAHTLYVRTNSAWVDTLASGAPSFAAPSNTIQAGTSNAAGSASTALRSDATFAIQTASAGTLTGANAQGTSASVARADHDHAFGAGSVGLAALAAGIRLDTINAPTASVSLNSQKITSLTDPTNPQDAATKLYVDNTAQGLDAKASVRVATTGSGTLASSFENGDTIDGITLATGDRILIKNQAAAQENGIYTVNATGAPTRATDADTWGELVSAFTFVEQGTTNADSGWVCTANQGGTLDTTTLTFVQFSGAGQITAGTGLTKTGNTIDAIGTAGRISVAADSIDIDSAYVGQSSITTLGTITTGTWTGTTIAIANGGTGQTSAKNARESGLISGGYYTSATHGAGTTITITQATHGLRSSRGIIIQVQDETSGNVEIADSSVASNGDVTVTFASSQSANSKRVTLLG